MGRVSLLSHGDQDLYSRVYISKMLFSRITSRRVTPSLLPTYLPTYLTYLTYLPTYLTNNNVRQCLSTMVEKNLDSKAESVRDTRRPPSLFHTTNNL